MVQQTKDSAFTEYGLAHAESGLSNSDKQLSAPLAAKKSELHALRRNESPTTVSRSIGSPFLMEDGEVAPREVKISGTKRPTPECMRGPAEVNSRSGHIVYVRRKPETDLAKRNIRDAQSDAVGCPQLKKLTDQDETPQQLMEINKPVICASDGAPLQRTSSSIGISSKNSSPENIEHFHLDCANPSPEDAIAVNVMLWEERNCHLQSVLKMLDQSDQYGYVQMLRSLSSVELSRHAVELEKRSIKLSLEEAKEMQRVRFIDVSGKYGKNVWTPSTQEEALQK